MLLPHVLFISKPAFLGRPLHSQGLGWGLEHITKIHNPFLCPWCQYCTCSSGSSRRVSPIRHGPGHPRELVKPVLRRILRMKHLLHEDAGAPTSLRQGCLCLGRLVLGETLNSQEWTLSSAAFPLPAPGTS